MAKSGDEHTGGHRHMQPNQNVLAYIGPPRVLGDCKKWAGGVGHVSAHGGVAIGKFNRGVDQSSGSGAI